MIYTISNSQRSDHKVTPFFHKYLIYVKYNTMGIIKTFSQWLNESVSSVRTLTDNVYQAIVDAGLGDNFNEPEYNDESPYLTAQADAFGFEITDEVDCIPFGEGSTFDYDKYIFYAIYITDEAPINDEGDTASIIIEYGEDDYTDGPEPWVLYYSAKEDNWDGNGPIKNPSSELANLICVISQAINPETKYHNHRTERSSDDDYDVLNDDTCSVETLYNYLIDHYELLGDKEITLNNGKTDDGEEWSSIQIPITLSGENIVTEVDAQNPSKIFAIDFTDNLMKYVEDMETVVEIDDQNINDDGYSRAFTNNSLVVCSEVVDFLDELLGLVSDPALRKK